METIPSDLKRLLAADSKVNSLWEDLTPIARRDFVSWIEEAKQPETRKRRIEVTRSKLVSGKRRPCCYAVIPMNLYKALAVIPQAKATWKDLDANERRDFVDWINKVKETDMRAERINVTCARLSSGKRHP